MGDYEMMMSEADNIMDRVWLADRDRASQERINWDLEGPDEEGEYSNFFVYKKFRVYRRSDFDNFYNILIGEELVKASATEREMLEIIDYPNKDVHCG